MMKNKTDIDLIEILMNCELDFDIRIQAAKELLLRTGVNKPWEELPKIILQ